MYCIVQWWGVVNKVHCKKKINKHSTLLLCLLQCFHTLAVRNHFSWTQEKGKGAVRCQVHNNKERVLAYFSHALSKPKHNYCTTRHELLAVVRTILIEIFHPYMYLYGRWFTVRTDNGCFCSRAPKDKIMAR